MSKTILSEKPGPIGIFDSGYGGLTILKHIQSAMPEYDFMYLGDNVCTLSSSWLQLDNSRDELLSILKDLISVEVDLTD